MQLYYYRQPVILWRLYIIIIFIFIISTDNCEYFNDEPEIKALSQSRFVQPDRCGYKNWTRRVFFFHSSRGTAAAENNARKLSATKVLE